ncbi:Abi family protein [Devosia sp. RR2S18]|uniref:Abi family protein n=1 Tax=Devosia rhizosphaerae TaxID=3049774 RepID=UPI0025402651|nr:Abi family protein [Devosia sp. RR2S18]WIJ26588.1 Abi family protein [Devosia sp. RR2S18]
MIVDDLDKASEYLSRIGYYRLSGYFHPFRQRGVDADGRQILLDTYLPDTRFQWATDLYAFDKGLRLQLLDVLERVEIFVRTAIALQIGRYDPWAHRLPNILDPSFTSINPRSGKVPHTDWLARLDNKAVGSKEEFAVHFRSKYSTSHMPVWVAVELLDFGPLSIFLSGMKGRDIKAVASSCDVPRWDVFATWVRSLPVVRNACAHHARVWNKPLVDQPRLPPKGLMPMLDHVATSPYSNKRLYAACAVARYLLLKINPRTQWSDRLKAHLTTFPTNTYISPKTMGFPDRWEDLDLWK